MTETALAIIDAQVNLIPKKDDQNFSGPSERAKAVALVEKGFNPTFHLMVYQGAIFVRNEGWWWWAHQDLELGRITSKPVPKDEREDYGLAPDEIGVLSYYFKGQSDLPVAQGFGKASKRPYTYSKYLPEDQKRGHPDKMRNPLDAENPYRMAEKRSEGQVIKKARPLGFDVGVAEETLDLPRKAPEPRVAQRAPAATKPSPSPAPGATTTESGKPPAGGQTETVDPASIRNLGDLFGVANRVLHLSPSQVLAKLGVSNKESIADVGDAWVKLNEKPPQDPLEAAGL